MTTWESYQRSQIRGRRVAVWKCQQLGEAAGVVIRPRLFPVEGFWEGTDTLMVADVMEWQEAYLYAYKLFKKNLAG